MSRIEKLTPDAVSADITVQRLLDQRRASAIAGSIRLDAIGVPTVSRRSDGSHFVMDGQTRLEALRIAGYGGRPIEMTVYTDLTIEEEAELFRLLNNTKQLTALDKFRISLVEKDADSLAINNIVLRNGYVTTAGSTNSCVAVASLRSLYHRDQGDTLNRALTVCNYAWGHRKHATHRTILGALGGMLFRYGHTVNLDRLAEKLKADREAANPTSFLGTIRALSEATGSVVSDAGAGKLVTIYNRHFGQDSESRLADWR